MDVKEAKVAFIFYTHFIWITESLKVAEIKTVKVFNFWAKYPQSTYFNPDEQLTISLKVCVQEKIENTPNHVPDASSNDETKTDESMQQGETIARRATIGPA